MSILLHSAHIIAFVGRCRLCLPLFCCSMVCVFACVSVMSTVSPAKSALSIELHAYLGCKESCIRWGVHWLHLVYSLIYCVGSAVALWAVTTITVAAFRYYACLNKWRSSMVLFVSQWQTRSRLRFCSSTRHSWLLVARPSRLFRSTRMNYRSPATLSDLMLSLSHSTRSVFTGISGICAVLPHKHVVC